MVESQAVDRYTYSAAIRRARCLNRHGVRTRPGPMEVDEGTGEQFFTPFETSLKSENIINRLSNNTSLPSTIRFLIPRLARVVLDVRNKRDVAHVGGEVNPNYSDSLFIVHCPGALVEAMHFSARL